MAKLLGDVTAVLVAKRPDPGSVKTRLVAGGAWSGEAAADLAWAMLRCTAQRLAAMGRLVLAVAPDGCGQDVARRLGVASVPIVDQGTGHLGQRLERVWKLIEPQGPIAFFSGDCPDVPDEAVGEIAPALIECDLAVGPTDDGGYWTLAARTYQPAVLQEIDWGSDRVYDQTCQGAQAAGLVVHSLPLWHDVDRPEDVDLLHHRLQKLCGSRESGLSAADPLKHLAQRLDVLLRPSPPPESATS